MTHKLTGKEVFDALREQRQGDSEEYIAGFSSSIDGKVCFDALALRLNEIIVPAAVPPPAVQTAMRNRLRAYRANDPAAYEKPTKNLSEEDSSHDVELLGLAATATTTR